MIQLERLNSRFMRKPTPFGEAVRKLRIDGEVSLTAMAATLGYSKAFVSATELGITKPSTEYVNKIIDLFCIEPNEASKLLELAEQSLCIKSDGYVYLKNRVSRTRANTANKFLDILTTADETLFKEISKFIDNIG